MRFRALELYSSIPAIVGRDNFKAGGKRGEGVESGRSREPFYHSDRSVESNGDTDTASVHRGCGYMPVIASDFGDIDSVQADV